MLNYNIAKYKSPRGLVQPWLVALCKKWTRNQPIFNHHTGIPMVKSQPIVGMTVDLEKPTPFQPLYLKAHGWNDGWFHKNQPFSYMRVGTWLVSCRFFAQTNRLESGWLIVGQVRERAVLREIFFHEYQHVFNLSYLIKNG